MKLSTLALGALISVSLNATAQNKPKQVTEPKKPKTEKPKPKNCVKPKTGQLVTDSLLIREPNEKVCLACGRG